MISILEESNDKQIERATEKLRKTGGKRNSFLDLEFKSSADDLCESPTLEVVKMLIEEGYDIEAHNPAINSDTLVDNQFSYVRNVCPHLEQALSALAKRLTDDPLSMIDECDIFVVTQAGAKMREVVSARFSCAKIVDLLGLYDVAPEVDTYEWIGW